jgi:uncharacterized membrane protein
MYSGSRNLDEVVAQGYNVEIGKYIRRGWEILKQNLGIYIGITLLLYVVTGGLPAILPTRLQGLGTLINVVVLGPINGGLYLVAFKTMKQRPSTFSDFFRGFNNFLPLFLVNLLASILIVIGMMLLFFPGLYLAVAYLFAIPFVVDRRFDFWEAMESSRKVITRKWFSVFGFCFVLGIVWFIGFLLLGVGVLVTTPLTLCAVAAAYEDIVGLSVNSMADDQIADSTI